MVAGLFVKWLASSEGQSGLSGLNFPCLCCCCQLYCQQSSSYLRLRCKLLLSLTFLLVVSRSIARSGWHSAFTVCTAMNGDKRGFKQPGVIQYTETARLSWSIKNCLDLNTGGSHVVHQVKHLKDHVGMNILLRRVCV